MTLSDKILLIITSIGLGAASSQLFYENVPITLKVGIFGFYIGIYIMSILFVIIGDKD